MAKRAGKDKTMTTLLQTAQETGTFEKLLNAVKTAGLEQTLSSAGPYTVFAPSDSAFEKLPKGTIDSLMKDPQKLASILKSHIVSGKLMRFQVGRAKTLKTLQGNEMAVSSGVTGLKIAGAKIVTADIETDNGVMHVIDTVIMPA